ncbi:polysaccharide pyruvyl transferase family protein [Acetoanaerobium sticklandii]|uniref:polysaccharide pyruvyl transferase family protein n=1 Tax=Acetoanaerobium sticklandii TaxID=1511 RepID=UPI003A932500
MNNKISIYGHYGSSNHGNEAIVRGFMEVFMTDSITVYSYQPNTDYEYKLNEIVDIKEFVKVYNKYSIKRIIRGILNRLLKDKSFVHKNYIKPFTKEIDGLYLLEAGDQYCEQEDLKRFYYYVNEQINKLGGKSIMMPATITVSSLTDQSLINDLNNYTIVYARESITFDALSKIGLKSIVKYAPDTAFKMLPKSCDMPELFAKRRILGITVGLLSQGKEKYYGKMIESVKALIQYVIDNTDYGIALIPHVNVGNNLNDIDTLNELNNKYAYTGRIALIPEQRADEQKYIIGKCSFMITLRTHVSVAAYSQAVPTIVLGYSQKSKGIAIDLFGTDENYVVRVEELDELRLITALKWLVSNEKEIKEIYSNNLSTYISKVDTIYDDLNRLRR